MYISIVVPVYNVAGYLDRFLESVLPQLQAHSDVELIFIDDGSTDESGRVLDDVASSDPRIRIVHQANQGVSAARNTGIGLVRGEYIVFADPDDWVAEDYLSCLKNALDGRELDIAVFSFEEHHKSGAKKKVDGFLVGKEMSGQGYIFEKLSQTRQIERSPWNKAFNSDYLKRQNLVFDPKLKFGEDMIFNMYAFYGAEKVRLFDDVIYHYDKQNEGSLTSLAVKDKVFGISQRLILSKCMRDIIAKWDCAPELSAIALGFSYRETLRMCAKILRVMGGNKERKKLAARLLDEVACYPLKQIFRYVTFTDFRFWLAVRYYAL